MDFVFNRRICRAVEEQEISLVLLQQLSIDVQTSDGSVWRRDDAIALQDLVQVTKVVVRTDVSYLQSGGTDGAQGEISARNCSSMHGIQNDEKPRIWRGRVAHRPILWRVLRRVQPGVQMHSPRITQFNGNEKMKAAFADISASTAWCRDRFDGLWQETAMLGDELGSICDGLQTVQRQLRDIKEAATTRNEEIYLEMDTLGRRMHEIEDSSSRDSQDVFDSGGANVDVLRKEIFHELGMVQDELRSIQRQLKETRESAPRTQENHLGMDMLGR
ncbi:hypothetical protein DFH08DRAFT_957599 [Mycena albidolilacea]|uniref:Uncharacterized protein n=1 Tax=Mycena albidolilacea TaxID=1033008 RepID=A0AAD7A7F4_9AGAR|nr:hypothetical protein DFH08DRAFT_957599 [Mycena albidolilacea]